MTAQPYDQPLPFPPQEAGRRMAPRGYDVCDEVGKITELFFLHIEGVHLPGWHGCHLEADHHGLHYCDDCQKEWST